MRRRTTSDARAGATRHAGHQRKSHHSHHRHKHRHHHHHHRHKHRHSTHHGSSPQLLSAAMVNRLFWRAGFGPTAHDRSTWTGKPLSDAVSWLLSTPAGLSGVPGTDGGSPLDPTGNDADLVLSWVDRMVRATNPFVERLTFFWHKHWANSRESVDPPQLMITQNQLFRSYSDFGTNPKANFHDMAYAVTIDPSMLRYLTGELNVKGAPNENYAREVMELFTLGVEDAAGNPNYSQMDVEQLAKALSGWAINDNNPNAVSSYFEQSNWYDGPKLIFGQFGNFNTPTALALVLSRSAHPAFIIGKLWSEFIVPPPDQGTLKKLISTYTGSGFQLKPVLEQILTHPLLFESINEPDMVKQPVVYVVGTMRALGLGVTDSTANDYLDATGQLPYFPPNVSGWEGGLSWLNTDTALARFAFVSTLLSQTQINDVHGENGDAAYARAYSACGSPWLSPSTVSMVQSIARAAAFSDANARIARQTLLRALILAGPDAQVM